MKTEVMTVTPAMAEKWLAATTFRNRNVSSTVVFRYAADIAKGEWLLNGESIVLDDNGNVIDGQHRLRAIMKSGRSIQSVVVRGVSSETFHTIDIGKKRGHGDVLSIAGYSNGILLAAGLRLIHAHKSGKSIDFERGSGSLSKYRINVLELVEAYPASVISAAVIKHAMKTTELARPGSFGILVHYEFTQENKIAAESFFHAAFEGIPMFGAKCPTLELRKKYGSLESQRLMKQSIAERFSVWKKTWEKFQIRFESEQKQLSRKGSSSVFRQLIADAQ
jgi:hypothetical protein